jgi:hypothetical protein
MTTTPAVGSLSTLEQPVPARTHHRRADGFDQQLQSKTSGQIAQSPGAVGGGVGSLLSSDLLRQIQSLTGLAAATPTA